MVILIGFSLLMSDVEPLFKCLLANSASSFEKCPSPLPIFIKVLGLFIIYFGSSIYVLNMKHLSDTCLTNIFSQSFICFFIFLIMPFNAQEFFISMKSNLPTFTFMCGAFWVCSKEPSLVWGIKIYFSLFFWKL